MARRTREQIRVDRAAADLAERKVAAADTAAAERAAGRRRTQRRQAAATVTQAAVAPARAARSASRRPYIAAMTLAGGLAFVQAFRSRQLDASERRAAVVSIVILLVVIAAVGEFSPEIATGFSALLLLSLLFGGSNAAHYLFVQLPNTFAGKTIVKG